MLDAIFRSGFSRGSIAPLEKFPSFCRLWVIPHRSPAVFIKSWGDVHLARPHRFELSNFSDWILVFYRSPDPPSPLASEHITISHHPVIVLPLQRPSFSLDFRNNGTVDLADSQQFFLYQRKPLDGNVIFLDFVRSDCKKTDQEMNDTIAVKKVMPFWPMDPDHIPSHPQ
jgi:hypothetical protein